MEDDYSTALLSLNLFGISAVVPNIVDLVGGALITVYGEGFDMSSANDTWCILSGVPIAATLVDTGTITCIAPRATNSLSACVSDTIDVRFGSRQTSQTTIGILRPVSAGIITAITDYGTEAYGSYDAPSNVTLSGFGFVNSQWAKCRLVNNSGHVVFIGDAFYINSTAAICQQPAGLPPTDTWSGLEYSHDGTYFGTSVAPFIIVGPTVNVVAVPTGSVIVSSGAAKMFDFSVYTTDVFYNRRLVLETRVDTVRCSSNVPELAIIGAAESVPFTPTSVRQVAIAEGISTFDSVYLQLPLTGFYTMYCFSFGDIKITTNFSFTVVPGVPAVIGMTPSSSWIVGVLSETTLLPKPTAWVQDVAGNHITNLSQIPRSMTLSTRRANAVGRSEVAFNTSVYVSLPDEAAFYTFDGVVVRSQFGVSTNLVLAVGYGVPTLVVPLQLEICREGVQYSEDNSFNCVACPDAAYCDGTSLLETRPGYWRGTYTSLEFFDCAPREACPSPSYCGVGYTGIKCATCEQDYGQTSDGCTSCWPKWASWLANIAGFGYLCVLVFFASIGDMHITSYEDFSERFRLGQLNEERVNELVKKLLISQWQMLTAVPYGQLGLPTWLTIFYSAGDSSTTGDPQQVFVTCTLAPRPADLLYISIILVPGIIAVFAFVSAIVAYRRSATHVREEEEMAYRIDVASGKHKHDERMEEVFVEMEKRRRERKIKRLERAKNKAAKLHDDDPKYYSDFDNIEDSTMSGINMSSTFASPLESTPGVAEGGQQTTFVNRQAIALRRPNRNLPPRRNVQYAMVDQHEITVASSDASFTIFSPPAPLDATILEQNSNSPTVVPAQKSSDFHPVLPNGDDGGDGEDGTQAPPPKGLKAGFERFVDNMINDADKENEPMDEDEIRRSGYHKGLLLWDGDNHHRHVRSIQVLSDSMRFNSTQERKLERYRAELFSSDFPEALQLLEKFDLAKQGNSSRRRIETWKKWFNIFLVCVTFILTQCSQTLVKYSLAQLQGCDRVDLGSGSVMLSKADPQIDCSSWEYFKLKYLAIAVLVFSTVFIPLLSFGFIKLVQKTTCNVKLVSLTLAEMNVVISRVQLEMDALNPTMFGLSLLDFDALARIEEQLRTAIVRQFEHFTDLVIRIPSIESRSICHFILIGGRCVLDKALKAKQADYIEGSEDLSRAAVEREWRNSLQGACREFFSVDPILFGTVSADDLLRASEMPPQEELPLEESPHLSPLSHDPFMRARVLDIVQEEEQRRKQLEDLWCKFDNIAVGGVMEARSLRAARSIFFFASGHFRTEVWWWESISMIKKSVLEVISAFIGDLSLSILLSVFVMLSYGVFNLWLKPYDDANLNAAENLTLTAVALSFGLMQLLFYPSVQESEPLKIFIFVMLIAINLLTMAALVYMMFTTSDSSVGRLKTIFKYIKRTYASIVHRRYVVKVGRARIKLEKYLRKYHRGGVLEDFYEEAWHVSREAAKTIAAGERRLSLANTPSSTTVPGASTAVNSPQQQQQQQSVAAKRKKTLKSFDEIAVGLSKHLGKAQRQNNVLNQLGDNTEKVPSMAWLSAELLAEDFKHAKRLVKMSYRIMLLAPDGDGVAASLSKTFSKLTDRAKNCLLCHHTDVLPFAKKPDAGLCGAGNPPPAQALQVAIPHNDVVAPEQHVGESQAKNDPVDERNAERTDRHRHDDAAQAAAGSPFTVLPISSGKQSSAAPSSVDSEVSVDREENYAEFLEVWLEHTMQAEVDYMRAFVCLCRSTRVLRGQLNIDELTTLNEVPTLQNFSSKSPAAPTLLSTASPNAIPSGGNSPSNRGNALTVQETILAVPEAGPHVRPSQSPVPVFRPSSSHNNHHQNKSPRDLTRASVTTEDLDELTQNPQTKKRVSIAAAPVGRSRRESRYITDFFPELSAEEQKKKSGATK
ncbi:transmembrane protein, putative [Bodo saltans]|uniref:Transmembrane protein, putative n=1 Tax=Bodo saltans TaxID=75058 RepID=A0A0S4JTK2_BODSA|nr:transmembrane protein, putative [Bodo saltans]|eukprot:CUG91884.1 transmembrane protein, putative [Bodo saltans]